MAAEHVEAGGQESRPPGFLPWEDDLEMVSKYLDRKVSKLTIGIMFVWKWIYPRKRVKRSSNGFPYKVRGVYGW